jgi:hypothetical protein
MNAPRLGCPINLTLEALGNRWSLIVIRDAPGESRIGIPSRRSQPQAEGHLQPDRSIHRSGALAAHMGGWGPRHTPASKELSIRAKILEDGGPKLWSDFMEELRHLHSACTPTSQENRNGEDSPRGTECAAGIPPRALAHCHGTQNENQRGRLRM